MWSSKISFAVVPSNITMDDDTTIELANQDHKSYFVELALHINRIHYLDASGCEDFLLTSNNFYFS